MSHSLRRLMTVALSVAALAAAPMAAITVVPPAVSSACPPGQTGVTNGCAPFCLPGLLSTPRPGCASGSGATPASATAVEWHCVTSSFALRPRIPIPLVGIAACV